LERVMADTEQVNKRVKELERDGKQLDGKLSGLRQTHLDLGAQKESMADRKEVLEEQCRKGEAEVETMRTELHRRKSRLQSLIEIHDKYEGFARGTRAVMQHTGDIASRDAGEQIWGLVADVVNAPEQLELAVEAALGDRLGGILVNNHDVGARAIQYLKDQSAGRSSFVAFEKPTSFGGSYIGIEVEDRTTERSFGETPRGEGVLGPLVDLVKFDPGFDRVGRQLLGGCVVVENLDCAIDIHKGGSLHTLVTVDGDIVEPGGVVSGGSRDAQGAGVLAQKREIRELEEITGSLEHDLADASARYISTKQELQRVTKTLESLKSETHEGELAITSNERDLASVRSELERGRHRATSLNTEQLELEERLRELATSETDNTAAHSGAEDTIDRCEREQLDLAEQVGDGRVRVEELSTALTELKVRVAQLGEKRASVAARAMQLEVADRELDERIARLRASIDEGGTRAQVLRADCETLSKELVGLRESHAGKAQELEQGRGIYETRLGELTISEMTVRELRAKSETLSGQVNGFEIKRNGLGSSRQVLEESIAERYRVQLRRELGDYHLRPLPGDEEDKRLEQLKNLIDRMGADINLTAIEEFKDVSERHEFLSTQQADLENAVGQLERAINKINKTSRKLFRETYDAINTKFQEVFPRLFRGGRAFLSLTHPDGNQDILEAGVEIMAQPPGKKNATVEQLSGGEKALTAVALIFAIFLIKPSPFCILDEVDAPLDDSNVDRYNEIVRQMTDRSQFIVITHNKRTMEIADHLYGVTMQEPGVSKIVSVNLRKIEDQPVAA
ncbi:MAG TPA: chromosome segregation protein SMC, partial [Kofleriaceae bacterium]|nr:chromosome segregation protein SMC [Kofleriaceae bacterium]